MTHGGVFGAIKNIQVGGGEILMLDVRTTPVALHIETEFDLVVLVVDSVLMCGSLFMN